MEERDSLKDNLEALLNRISSIDVTQCFDTDLLSQISQNLNTIYSLKSQLDKPDLIHLSIVVVKNLFSIISGVLFTNVRIGVEDSDFYLVGICSQSIKILNLLLSDPSYELNRDEVHCILGFVSKMIIRTNLINNKKKGKDALENEAQFISIYRDLTELILVLPLDEVVIDTVFEICQSGVQSFVFSEIFLYIIYIIGELKHEFHNKIPKIFVFLNSIYQSFSNDSIVYTKCLKMKKLVTHVYVIVKVVQNLFSNPINPKTDDLTNHCTEIEEFFQKFFFQILFSDPGTVNFNLDFIKHFCDTCLLLCNSIVFPASIIPIIVIFKIITNTVTRNDIPVSHRAQMIEILGKIICEYEKFKNLNYTKFDEEKWRNIVSTDTFHEWDILHHIVILSYLISSNHTKKEIQSLFNFYSSRCYSVMVKDSLLSSKDLLHYNNYETLIVKLSENSYSYILSICPHSSSSDAKCSSREYMIKLFSSNDFSGGSFLILSLANNPSSAIRVSSLKALLQFSNVFPAFFDKNEVYMIIKIRLHDRSALVRKFALEIVAQCVINQINYAERYVDLMIERIHDSSLTIRKVVVKSVNNFINSGKSFPKLPEILFEISQKIDDVPSISKIIASIFGQVFSCIDIRNTQRLAEIKQTFISFCEVAGDQSYTSIKNIFSLIQAQLSETNQQLFFITIKVIAEDFFKEFLQAFSDSNCTYAFQFLCCVASLFPGDFHSKIPLLISLLETVEYSNQYSDFLLQYTCKILSILLPTVSSLHSSLYSNLEASLIKLILSKNQSISDAIICFKTVIQYHSKNYQSVIDLFNSYTKFISDYSGVSSFDTLKDLEDSNNTSKQNICRILYTLGIILKNFPPALLVQGSEEDINNFVRKMSKLYFCYLTKSDSEIQVKAVFVAGNLFNHCPKFYLDFTYKQFFIENLINKDSCSEVKHRIIKSFLDYLLFEESKTLEQKGVFNFFPENTNNLYSGASLVIQAYVSCFQISYLSSNNSIRFTIHLILRISIKLGLLHPQTFQQLLITMCNDPDSKIRIPSISILKIVLKRSSKIIFNVSPSCLNFSYQLFCVLYDAKRYSQLIKTDMNFSFFSSLYQLMDCYKIKRNFILSIIKCLDVGDCNFCIFLTLILAYLPYKDDDGVYFLIYHLDLKLNLLEVPQNFEENLSCDNFTDSCFKFVLILTLKSYIIKTFSLSDDKINQYNPSFPIQSLKSVDRNMKRFLDTEYILRAFKKITPQNIIVPEDSTHKPENYYDLQNLFSNITNFAQYN